LELVTTPGFTAPSGMASGSSGLPRRARFRDYFRPATFVFWGFHVAAIVGVIRCGFSWRGLALAVGLYFVRMVLVTAGYHRYFSHRAFKTSRAFQFLLALGAQSALQKGVLWWAAHHRFHHKHSDTPLDPHSVKQRGFLWSHVGWITAEDYDGTNLDLVGDLARYPELRILNRPGIQMLPGLPLALVLFAVGGLPAFVWGFLVSTVMLWHGSFSINSLSHLFGGRRYPTGDDSRNNWALALLTTGEGWHNNHHHYQSSANQGFRWWEIDVTFYVLRLFERCGLVWDLRRPPAEVLRAPGDPPPDAALPRAA
jgi:stearoyl-CoA desaturase (Delta-9 desaturase)